MAFALLQLRFWLSSVLPDHDDDDRGAALVEYALLMVFIVIVCVIAMTVLGTISSDGITKGGEGIANNN
jgi:Flp pilus assembly pilin Flp